MDVPARNTVTLTGTITTREPLRHTPAGLPLLHFKLHHQSQQLEAGIERQTEFEVGAVVIGEIASQAARIQPGAVVTVQGFLAARRRMGTQLGTQLVLHVTKIANSVNQT